MLFFFFPDQFNFFFFLNGGNFSCFRKTLIFYKFCKTHQYKDCITLLKAEWSLMFKNWDKILNIISNEIWFMLCFERFLYFYNFFKKVINVWRVLAAVCHQTFPSISFDQYWNVEYTFKKKKNFYGAELCFAIMPLVWPYPTVLAW